MKRKHQMLIFIVFCGVFFTQAACLASETETEKCLKNSQLKPSATVIKNGQTLHFGESKKYTKLGVNIVILQGQPYEIGYARGMLLQTEIREYYTAAVESLKKEKLWSYETVLAAAKNYYKAYLPKEFHEELRGLSSALDLDFDELLAINAFGPITRHSGCTSIVIKDRTGIALRSRNLDLSGQMTLPAVLYFIQPTNGHAFVSISHNPAAIGIRTGFNEKGVLLGGHSIAGSTQNGLAEGMPEKLLRRLALQYSSTVDDVGDVLKKEQRSNAKIWVVSDLNTAKVFEFDSHAMGSYQIENEYLIVTNFTKVLKNAESYRFGNDIRTVDAESFLGKHGGRLDLHTLIEVNRIASLSGAGTSEFEFNNLHSIIAQPSSLDFWIAIDAPYATRGRWKGFNLNKELYGTGQEPEITIISEFLGQ